LDTIRVIPQERLYRPISEIGATGAVSLIDGWQRIHMFMQRGATQVEALVKVDAAFASEVILIPDRLI